MVKNLRKTVIWLIAASMAASVTACSGGPAMGGAESGGAPASAAAAETGAAAETDAAAETGAAAENSVPAGAEAGGEEIKLPAAGDELYGFRVTDITPFPQKNAQLVSLDHLKSGAEVLYIACDSPDKAVNVFYRTEAESDQGIPHVFEHITLSGSGKYPNSDLFDVISAKTYKTYMNAGTYQQMTGYNMSSLSEDQLLAIMDYYMDGLTDPLALRDEHPLKRESFRYELDDPEGDITVTGAVFNEMEAANAVLDRFVNVRTAKALYPESTMSYNSGGYRDDILTITMDELRAFYEKHYHPSNMLITLYGDLDLSRFLEKLDRDYLSKYDKKEITIEDRKYVPWKGERTETCVYPVTKDASAENGSVVSFAVSLGDISAYDLQLMDVVGTLLTAESSVLKQKMMHEFPSSVFSVNLREEIRQPVLSFELRDAAKGDAEKFRRILKDSIDEICRDGLNKDLVDSLVRDQQIETVLSAEQPGGIGVCSAFALFWSQWGDRLTYLDCVRAIENLREEADKGTLDQLLEKYLKTPEQAVLMEVDPGPGQRELLDEEFEAKLAAMKAGMSDDEVAQMVESTKEFRDWSEISAEEAGPLLEKLKAVEIGDLPEEVYTAEVTDTEEDGIRKLVSVIDTAPYVESELYLDASSLEYDEILDYSFLGELLGSLATEHYTVEELETAFSTAAYRHGIGAGIVYDDETGDPQPVLSVLSMELEDTIRDAWALQEEILYHTDFSDADRIRYLASAAETGFVQKNSQNPAQIILWTAQAAADPDRMYEYHASGFDYLAYLKKVAAMSDEEIAVLTERLEKVLGKLLNRNGAVYTAVGSSETLAEDWDAAKVLLEKLDDADRTPADYSGELSKIELPKRLAVAVPDSVSYSGFAAANADTGFEDSGKDQVIMTILYGNVMYPAFRYEMGAYGFDIGPGRTCAYMFSYREPDIRPTYEYFQGAAEGIRNLELTQEQVNDSILNKYSELAYPDSPLTAAQTEIFYRLRGRKQSYAEETLAKMREAKTVTPADVTASADRVQKMIEEGVWATAGNSAAIKKNAGLYDLVIEDLVK